MRVGGEFAGGRGGNRTLNPFRATDFKSVVYASSTTRPLYSATTKTIDFIGLNANVADIATIAPIHGNLDILGIKMTRIDA